MAFQKLDKKQVPQVAAMAVLSCGLLGYFAKQMMTPSPAAARTAPVLAAPTAAPRPALLVPTGTAAPANAASSAADPAAPAADADVPPPPAPETRDPFQQTVSSTPASAVPVPPAKPAPKMASLVVPHVPALPATGGVFAMPGLRPLPAASGPVSVPFAPSVPLAPPAWQVTGVLASGNEHIAILRSGEQRRFVRDGDWVDSEFQVGHVGRDAVTLHHGAAFYTLPLGGSHSTGNSSPSPAPAVPVTPDASFPPPAAVSARPAAHRFAGSKVAARKKAASKIASRKPAGHALLANGSVHAATLLPVPNATPIVRTLPTAAPRLALTPFALAVPTVRPVDFSFPPAPKGVVRPIVKVAAYHAKSVLKAKSVKTFTGGSPVPPGLLAAGTLAPDFALRTLNGAAVSLSQYKGHPVVLAFWASWVDESGAAVPRLSKIAQAGHAAFVSVGSWDNHSALLSFAGTHGIDPQTVLCDEAVPNQSVAVRLFHAPDVPTCYILDQDGHVVAAFVGFGPDTAEAVRAVLQTLEAS